MSALKMLSVALPNFPGFYHSDLSEAVDREDEHWVEYRTDGGDTGPDCEAGYPEQLSLADDLSDLLYRHTEYDKAYRSLALAWADAFDYHAGQVLNLTRPDKRNVWRDGATVSEPWARPSIGLKFEEMTSPREYNFTTDRVFATVPLKTVRDLFKRSAAERHATLAKAIKDRHSSYSGFISFYSNDLREWLAKPLAQWDENELGTLIYAALALTGEDMESTEYDSGFFADVRETTIGDEGAYQEWESAVNWTAFDAERAEKRRAKLDAWLTVDSAAAEAWTIANPEHFATFKGDE